MDGGVAGERQGRLDRVNPLAERAGGYVRARGGKFGGDEGVRVGLPRR
jgi:hypothetical protein